MLAPAVSAQDVVLAIHISAVVIGFGVTFAYPLFFAVLSKVPLEHRASFHRAQDFVGQRLISPALVVIIGAGAYLASDEGVWSKAWVGVPLAIAVILGGMGGAFFSPRERKLAELADAGDAAAYNAASRPVAIGGALASVLVLVAIFFMTLKPGG